MLTQEFAIVKLFSKAIHEMIWIRPPPMT